MVPCIGAKIGDDTYYPLYNNKAMFRVQAFGDDVIDAMSQNTEDGFEKSFEVFTVLCEEGEAVRQYYGYPAGPPVPTWEQAQMEFLPADIIAMKNAVFAAITLGCERKVPDSEDIDLTLLEAQKKTEKRTKKQTTT